MTIGNQNKGEGEVKITGGHSPGKVQYVTEKPYLRGDHNLSGPKTVTAGTHDIHHDKKNGAICKPNRHRNLIIILLVQCASYIQAEKTIT
jgi:hypothetical protein